MAGRRVWLNETNVDKVLNQHFVLLEVALGIFEPLVVETLDDIVDVLHSKECKKKNVIKNVIKKELN